MATVPATPYYQQPSAPYATSLYKTSTRPDAAWRANEPAGYTALTELTFEQAPEDTPGWNEYSLGNGNFDRISDPTNPSGTDMVGRILYPAAFAGGSAPVNIGHDTIATSNAKKLYFCAAFKMSSNFQYHSTGTNKLMFVNISGYGGGGDPYYINVDSDTNPAKVLPVIQGAFPRTWNSELEPEVNKDEWFIIESHKEMNSAGVADGILEQWHDAVLRISETDVEFVDSQYIWNNAPKLQPTWGGAGDTVTSDFYLYCAGIYVSWSV